MMKAGNTQLSLCLFLLCLMASATFVYADGEHEHASHSEAGSTEEAVPLAFKLYGFIHPLGIAAYCSLWITVLLGLLKFKFKVQRINMNWHFGFAILTLVLATLHASLVLYMHYS